MKRLFSFLTFVALLVMALPAAAQDGSDTGPNAKGKVPAGVARGYIVQMIDAPVVSYRGGVAGLRATKPGNGKKIDPTSSDVVQYAAYLDARHNEALNKVGGAQKLYDYHYSYNGFAANLTLEQASAMKQVDGVVVVSPDEVRHLDTSTTPDFLGLTGSGGFWEKLGGVKNAGEGIVVGIVDSGIWPEHPSVSDRVGVNGNFSKDGKLDYQQLPGWHGKCVPGEEFPASLCNQKLIGGQYFNAGFGGNAGIDAAFPYEFNSARDADGHGTHTATTSAGNNGVTALVGGVDLGKISGMAPRARLAIYKVCWGSGEGGCVSSDSVAAIDQAVADGVDVINFSISGSTTSNLDPVEVAFLFAADAGVFVSASAGNSGPGASTVAHNSPWLMTVAAGSHDRVYFKDATLGNGVTYNGVGTGAAVPSSPLVLSDNVGLPGANPSEVNLCFSGTLDPALVTGKIVVCDRGVNARTDKSLAVQMAGGVGMILLNTSINSLNGDAHYVPTVHLQSTDRAAVRAYVLSDPTPTASLSLGVGGAGALAPDVASFSSRGPALAGGGNLLKPDIMAPGVDVLAGYSPAGGGRLFDFLSGTSMSSPHLTGIGALMKQAHPNWSPAAIKSALMTTAGQTRNNGSLIPGTPFGFGSGQVAPTKAIDPGLVYDASWTDWLTYLCATGQLTSASCTTTYNKFTDPSNLNYPSIAVSALADSRTITRTVTNVSTPGTYTVSVSAPAGFTVSVSPSSLVMGPGQSKSYSVTITRTTATFNSYAFGSLTWSDGTHAVRSPIAVRPVALAIPLAVSSTGSPVTFQPGFGYTGTFAASAQGLVPATVISGSVGQDPDQVFAPTDTVGVYVANIEVPAGVTYVRFATFTAETNSPNNDLDMYVYRDGVQVGSSGSGTSDEEVNLVNPPAATYQVYVHGWSVTPGGATFNLYNWQVTGADAGNMSITAPAAAVSGSSGSVTLTFSGLTPGVKYLGRVVYNGGATDLSSYSTLVRVNP